MSENNLEAHVKELGFHDLKEFHRLSSTVPFLTPEDRARFKVWQHTDGTKGGILKLMDKK